MNNMYILASGLELQAVRFGYVIYPKIEKKGQILTRHLLGRLTYT
jgi:hypothetical protein